MSEDTTKSHRTGTSDMPSSFFCLPSGFSTRNFVGSLHRQSFSRCNGSRKSAIFFPTDSSKCTLDFYGDRFYAFYTHVGRTSFSVYVTGMRILVHTLWKRLPRNFLYVFRYFFAL